MYAYMFHIVFFDFRDLELEELSWVGRMLYIFCMWVVITKKVLLFDLMFCLHPKKNFKKHLPKECVEKFA